RVARSQAELIVLLTHVVRQLQDAAAQEREPTPAVILPSVPRSPEITVAAVTESNGRFLVVEERINRRLVFNQPAGHVERGETLLEGVIGEFREEPAGRSDPVALIGVYLWRTPASGRTTMRFAFTGSVADHDASQALDRGIVRTHWLSRSELLEREPQLRSPL